MIKPVVNSLSSFLGMNYNDLIVMSLEGLSKGNHDKLIPKGLILAF